MRFRMPLFSFILLAVIGTSLTVLGRQPAATSAREGIYSEPQAKRGEIVASQFCRSCHGSDLMGADDGPPLAGPDFVDAWKAQTVGDLFEKISTTMPANDPGRLTPEQTADLVAYILQMNKYPSRASDLGQDLQLLKQTKLESPTG